MIPKVPEVQDSLNALTLAEEVSRPAPDDRCVVVCEPSWRMDGGKPFQDPTALVLRQTSAAPMTIPRLLKRVAEALHKAGHSHVSPKNQHSVVAGKVLGMASALSGSTGAPLDVVNQIIASISPARVSQWAVLINPSTSPEQYRFGDFVYGEVELNKLQYRSEKAGSDFARRYGDSLRSRRSILREGRTLHAIDLNALHFSADSSAGSFLYRITDDYYASLAEIERQEFMMDLDRQQAIFGAAGLGTIPSETLRQVSAMTQWITIFERPDRGRGWVVPNQNVLHLSSTEPKALSDGYLAIKTGLKLIDWNAKPLDPLIQAFCQYLTAAQDHERSERIEEALLHVVFALDLLLGASAGDALTLVLAERTAIVSHLAVQKPIEAVVAFVKECYDMRSAYVHRGGKGGLAGLNERFEMLFRVARAVLGAACFARLQPWCQTKDARDSWVNRIDILKAKHVAGVPFAQAELQELGLQHIRLRTGELVSVLIEARE